MAARTRGRIVMVVLAVAAAAGLLRATAVEREKQKLAASYKEAKVLLDQLSQARSQLSSELAGAKETIEGKNTTLVQLQGELGRVQEELDSSVQELAALHQEHEQLRSKNLTLANELGTVQAENRQLEAKLSDIRQLKLAIRDVRRQIWERRFAAVRQRWQARAAAMEQEDRQELASGNRGYVLRDGFTTIGKAPRLHVHVLEPRAEE